MHADVPCCHVVMAFRPPPHCWCSTTGLRCMPASVPYLTLIPQDAHHLNSHVLPTDNAIRAQVFTECPPGHARQCLPHLTSHLPCELPEAMSLFCPCLQPLPLGAGLQTHWPMPLQVSSPDCVNLSWLCSWHLCGCADLGQAAPPAHPKASLQQPAAAVCSWHVCMS